MVAQSLAAALPLRPASAPLVGILIHHYQPGVPSLTFLPKETIPHPLMKTQLSHIVPCFVELSLHLM